MRKSASLPGESEPSEENKPSDNAPFLVATLRVYSRSVKSMDFQHDLAQTNLIGRQPPRLRKGHLCMVHQADRRLSVRPNVDQ